MSQGIVFMKLYGFSVVRSLYNCVLCAGVLHGYAEALFAVSLCGRGGWLDEGVRHCSADHFISSLDFHFR